MRKVFCYFGKDDHGLEMKLFRQESFPFEALPGGIQLRYQRIRPQAVDMAVIRKVLSDLDPLILKNLIDQGWDEGLYITPLKIEIPTCN